ncbi:hypothetical protein LUX39_29065 [Actinomadura madurae]|nr:hypothetical protein [Actinomadura madurae]MCP9951892.1 hypothetical protein [Actinomadura madurae]MCP9968662.1 hypothetical protein [Actinomadura madurae]MCQ0017331.1 hypothetical protein [Actinomadura madurae]
MNGTRPVDGREGDRHADGHALDDDAAARALLVHELLEGRATDPLAHHVGKIVFHVGVQNRRRVEPGHLPGRGERFREARAGDGLAAQPHVQDLHGDGHAGRVPAEEDGALLADAEPSRDLVRAESARVTRLQGQRLGHLTNLRLPGDGVPGLPVHSTPPCLAPGSFLPPAGTAADPVASSRCREHRFPPPC